MHNVQCTLYIYPKQYEANFGKLCDPASVKVDKHEIFVLTFFAETETTWSQGPVTRDFKKSFLNWQRYSTFKHFRACSACDEIGS
jgi:hypothetical protein